MVQVITCHLLLKIRLLQMNRKDLILFLLLASWPAGMLRYAFRGSQEVHYFILPELWDSLSWYSYHITHIVTYIFIFFAMWLYMTSNMRKDKDVINVFTGLFIVQILDLPHYLLLRQQSLYFIIFQGLIILLFSLKIPIEKWRNKKKNRHI